MAANNNKLYSVITGDIIRSSKLSSAKMKRLIAILGDSSRVLKKAFPSLIINNVDIFRGDGWQVLIKKPELSLRVALYFRAYIKSKMKLDKINTRMAISIGTVSMFPQKVVMA